MNSALQEIVEYRGVENLVAAKVLVDDENNFTTDTPFAIAGVAEVSKTTESSTEAKYYDNIPALTVMGVGADTITINVSAIPFDVLAAITGQAYDELTGTLVEGTPSQSYFALGYKTQKTDGSDIYVWREKGTFAIPDQTNTTKNAGTDSNGQTLTYTGVTTTHKFTKTGEGAKGVQVDMSKDLADVSTFFASVQTPDTIQAKSQVTYTVTNTLTNCTSSNSATSVNSGAAYSAVITAEESYTLGAITVTMGGVDISSAAVTGSAISIPRVTGNIIVTCSATA